jgi:hypothetical protein
MNEIYHTCNWWHWSNSMMDETMFMNQMNYKNAIDRPTCHQFSYFISHMIWMVFLKPFFCVIIILVSVKIKEFNNNWEPRVHGLHWLIWISSIITCHHHLSYFYQSHANLLFLPTLDLNFKYDFSWLSLTIINPPTSIFEMTNHLKKFVVFVTTTWALKDTIANLKKLFESINKEGNLTIFWYQTSWYWNGNDIIGFFEVYSTCKKFNLKLWWMKLIFFKETWTQIRMASLIIINLLC